LTQRKAPHEARKRATALQRVLFVLLVISLATGLSRAGASGADETQPVGFIAGVPPQDVVTATGENYACYQAPSSNFFFLKNQFVTAHTSSFTEIF
jgi:hypothetical protein